MSQCPDCHKIWHYSYDSNTLHKIKCVCGFEGTPHVLAGQGDELSEWQKEYMIELDASGKVLSFGWHVPLEKVDEYARVHGWSELRKNI